MSDSNGDIRKYRNGSVGDNGIRENILLRYFPLLPLGPSEPFELLITNSAVRAVAIFYVIAVRAVVVFSLSPLWPFVHFPSTVVTVMV